MSLILVNNTGTILSVDELGQQIESGIGTEQDISQFLKGELVTSTAIDEIESLINADQIFLRIPPGATLSKADSLSVVANIRNKEAADLGPVNNHATQHENGGVDEIDVSDLSGLLADNQRADLTAPEVTGILPIAKGGTGSGTQNFVDLTNAQSISGIKTFNSKPQVPGASIGADDAVNKSELDAAVAGFNDKIGAPVQDIPALKAVGSADREDKQIRLVEDEGANYRFDAQSSEAEDLPRVVTPNSGTGRWYKANAQTQDHNNLLNLQGGAPADYQHLTTTEKGRIPTTGEKAALAGTDGTPGAANEYVTDSDPRNTNARTPTAHASMCFVLTAWAGYNGTVCLVRLPYRERPRE